jgi:Spy/CpxP family protein refolding chaperone
MTSKTLGIVTLLLATALPAVAQPPGPPAEGWRSGQVVGDRRAFHGRERLAKLARYLELTEAQREGFRTAFAAYREDTRSLREQRRALREELGTLLDKEDPDPAAVGSRVIVLRGLGDQLRDRRRALRDELAAQLTAEQRERWKSLQEVRRAFGPRGPRGHR